MKNIIILLLLLFFKPTTVCCQITYWQQQVNYSIDVTLNDENNTLDGIVKMEYFNNSPDTLHFIWFHLWPNAYKNDRTAFSDQLLINGRTDFYFSDENNRGYINRLDFKVNGLAAQTQNDSLHIDIIKLLLPQPLAPANSIKIETPFHVKLPLNFSRGGHADQSYQITQWYPKPAVYDKTGWHAIPYLDQGEFYSEFGNYKVQINIPANYIVAATGQLINETLETNAALIKSPLIESIKKQKHPPFLQKRMALKQITASSPNIKTLRYQQDSVHDFAWFADKDYLSLSDTMLLAGKIIKIAAYFKPDQKTLWKNSLQIIKKTVLTRGHFLGDYPYNTISVVEAETGADGGMEYPTISTISPIENEEDLETLIEHEVGHNWNYGILATNERNYPWMDEGINTYYDNRYLREANNIIKLTEKKKGFLENRLPTDQKKFTAQNLYATQKDQPIETSSENFTAANYNAIAYYKTGQWMLLLQNKLGTALFDSCMHQFYQQWKFKHPYPGDFKNSMETVSGKNLDAEFLLLQTKGELPGDKIKKDIKLSGFFNFRDTDKHHYIFISPAIGANIYDKLMLGILIHNYTLPAQNFQYLISPMYASGSKHLNGLGRISYQWYPGKHAQKIEISLSAETFSGNAYTDSVNVTTFLRFSKIVPSFKYIFPLKNPLSHINKYIQWKTFFIKEQSLFFTKDNTTQQDIITYPTASRYFNQLKYVIENEKALYPYNVEFLAEQSNNFIRLALTTNYYLNYVKGGGMNLRFFAGKFIYLGDKTYIKQSQTDIYHLNLSGPKGYEDYGYSNYFTGRNDYTNFSAQQIMNRDGFFKVRTDMLSNKIGKTDDWLMALNLWSDVPKAINILRILPGNMHLKYFIDIGTYAEAWQKNAETGKFVYDAGLQVSLCKDIIQIYLPLFYSSVYSDYFKSTIITNRFIKNISFSIDIQKFKLKKLVPQLAY